MATKSENEITINGIDYVKKSSIPKIHSNAKPKGKMPFVLIRSDRSGIHFGYLKSKSSLGDKWNVTLENSRRVYYWTGAATISQLAIEGTKKPSDCKFCIEIPSIEIAGVVEIIPISLDAEKNLKGVAVWKM